MTVRRLLPLFALAALLLPSFASAETAPVLVERVDAGHLTADVGSNATASFELRNINPTTDFFVSVATTGPPGWTVGAQPANFVLTKRVSADPAPYVLDVVFAPADSPREAASFTVTLSLVSNATGEVTKVTEDVVVGSAAPPRVLNAFANPLGAPLDNEWGTFLLDMLVWIGFALLAVVAGTWVVRGVTMRASRYVSSEMASKLRLPLFLFIVSLGLSESFKILPRNFLTETVVRIVLAIGVGVFGLYVLYKVLDAALYYYEKEIAPKTETNIDDVVIPVVRKVGIVALYVVGIVLSLRELGWDPTIIFAGAGIAGLVIAFAAQDTFSNLFSGIFLMLDRPFVEGDDITLETGETARVERIGLRTTRLYNYMTHESLTVPNNSLATKRIINHTGPDARYRLVVAVGVDYASDPEKVKRLLLDVANAHPRVQKDGEWPPSVRFTNFGESSLDFTLKVTIPHFKERQEIGSELRFAIKKAFEANGIDIPFPHRTLVVKGEGASRILQPSAPAEPQPSKK